MKVATHVSMRQQAGQQQLDLGCMAGYTACSSRWLACLLAPRWSYSTAPETTSPMSCTAWHQSLHAEEAHGFGCAR